MNTSFSIFNRKLPVLYRWGRRQRYFPHAVLLSCVLMFLPLGIITGVKISSFTAANKAMAATRALSPEHAVLDEMPEGERAHYAAALNSLVVDDPDKLYQLIEGDLLVMFREPDLKRQDGTSSVWQYRTESCVLDVYFERSDEGFDAVSYYEMRERKIAAFKGKDSAEDKVNQSKCLQSLYKKKSA